MTRHADIFFVPRCARQNRAWRLVVILMMAAIALAILQLGGHDGAMASSGVITLSTPSGVTLQLTGAPVIQTGPTGYTVEAPAVVRNGSTQALYVLSGLALERTDLTLGNGPSKRVVTVCRHHFLWWDWDCFTYCYIPLEPTQVQKIPVPCDPDLFQQRVIHYPGMQDPGDPPPGPVHLEGGEPPADIVLAVIATHDLQRITTALDKKDPSKLKLGPPPLQPGAALPILLAVHVAADAAPRGATQLVTPPSFAVSLADDEASDTQLLVSTPVVPQPQCDITMNKRCEDVGGDAVATTCEVAPKPYVCTTPITSLSMQWNGPACVRIAGTAGASPATPFDIDGICPGDAITVSGYNGNQGNDVFWNIYTAGTTGTNGLLGQSTFRLSCSDGDMNGPEDCGNTEGDATGTGVCSPAPCINQWTFNGMAGGGQTLDCALPGGSATVKYHYAVTNHGAASVAGVNLIDAVTNSSGTISVPVADPFNLNAGETKAFTVVDSIVEKTTDVATADVTADLMCGKTFASNPVTVNVVTAPTLCPTGAANLTAKGRQVSWALTDPKDGQAPEIAHINISWLAANGALTEVSLGKRKIFSGSLTPPSASIDAFSGLAKDRTLDDGKEQALTFKFVKNAASGPYEIMVYFTNKCSAAAVVAGRGGPPAPQVQTFVGVIPETAGVCPAGSDYTSFYMDDEDHNNQSSASGWVGAIQVNAGNTGTRLGFCRVSGDNFYPVSQPYGVLSLSESCPTGSAPLGRFFDNEDNNNQNSPDQNDRDNPTDPFFPSALGHNTELVFCSFPPDPSSLHTFPVVGTGYGVFAPSNLPGALAVGTVHTDDEDSFNVNKYYSYSCPFPVFHGCPFHSTASSHDVFSATWISGASNTDFHIAKVR
jgi:hypothetical protein